LLATTISSTYERAFLSTCSFRVAFIILQKVGPALCRPPGILKYQYVSKGVMKLVYFFLAEMGREIPNYTFIDKEKKKKVLYKAFTKKTAMKSCPPQD
jgi:hypothetical protein